MLIKLLENRLVLENKIVPVPGFSDNCQFY
jgi:hypothetical protein